MVSSLAAFLGFYVTGIVVLVILVYVHVTWLMIINNQLTPLVAKYQDANQAWNLVLPGNAIKQVTQLLRHALTLGFVSKKRTRQFIINYFDIPTKHIQEQEKLEGILNELTWRSMVSTALFTLLILFFILRYVGILS